MASGAGRRRRTSETRDNVRSTLPRNVAEAIEKTMATVADTTAALNPTTNVGQAPARSIENTSRPKTSVPNQ